MPQNFNLEAFLISMIVIICSLTLHEFGHAFSADRLGDPTPRSQGRVNLWPDKHFEPIGFLFIVIIQLFGVGLGWAKPVMVNSRYFRNPRRDMLIVTICGPLMNLLLALVFGLAIRLIFMTQHENWLYVGGEPTTTGQFLWSFLTINLSLFFFNLIPVPPLDGSKVFAGLAPADMAQKYESFMASWGMFILMVLVFSGAIGKIIGPPTLQMARLLIGNQFG